MNDELKKNIIDFATRKIELKSLYETNPELNTSDFFLKSYEEAINARDAEALQYLAMLPKPNYNDLTDINRRLITECWHNQHEEIARFFQEFVRDVECVDSISRGMDLGCVNWFDKEDAFIRKCAYVLGDLGTEESIAKLKELSTSENELIKKYCSYQLERLGLM